MITRKINNPFKTFLKTGCYISYSVQININNIVNNYFTLNSMSTITSESMADNI